MCEPASFIFARGKQAFFSARSDRHTVIATEHNLTEGIQAGVESANYAKCEIIPPNYDYTLPFSEWVFRVDENSVPNWMDVSEAEAACRVLLPEWAETHIHREGVREVGNGESVVALGGVVTVQSDGECWYPESGSTVNVQLGGLCWYPESGSTVNVQSGGKCWYPESGSTVNVQSGGECWHPESGAIVNRV